MRRAGNALMVLTLSALIGAITVILAPTGHATYGGCKEAYVAPHSAAANQCRAHGWVIAVGPRGHGIISDPHGVVRYQWLRSCANEDAGRSCSWNLNGNTGNNRGLAYWFGPGGRVHYVWPHAARPGRSITAREARNLAGRHTARYWRTCVIAFTRHTQRVACPDGARYSDPR